MTHDEPHAQPAMTGKEALRRLLEGNERYLRGESRFTGLRREMLDALTGQQQPFAAILGCSDSRVPPELIFDAVLGELFVIRVAGNVFSVEVAGSLQYAGAHLQTPLFVVLGHEGCGAVQAALATRLEATQQLSRIQLLVDNILPAVGEVDATLSRESLLSSAVEANVRWTLRQIAETPEARARLADGDMTLVGAIYELATGRVRLLE